MENKKRLLLLFKFYLFLGSSNALEGEGIMGGKRAPTGEYPYVVSVQGDGVHICSGGILTDIYVVTAAHCVVDPINGHFIRKKFQVVGGITDVNSYPITRHTSDVTNFFVPLEYFQRFVEIWTGDIAILKLKNAFNFLENPHLNYLELPSVQKRFVGKTAIFTGFGANEFKETFDLDYNKIIKEKKSDGKLRRKRVTVWNRTACSWLKGWIIPESILCAQMMSSSPTKPIGCCDGDSGGPLVINKKILIGVISTGLSSCDERCGPSLYTRVTSHLGFINKVLENHPSVSSNLGHKLVVVS